MGRRKGYIYDAALQDRMYKRRKRWNKIKTKTTEQLFQRDGKRCSQCGATENLTIDHIIPISKDGTNDLDNLQVLCLSCNCKKGIY